MDAERFSGDSRFPANAFHLSFVSVAACRRESNHLESATAQASSVVVLRSARSDPTNKLLYEDPRCSFSFRLPFPVSLAVVASNSMSSSDMAKYTKSSKQGYQKQNEKQRGSVEQARQLVLKAQTVTQREAFE